MACLRTRVAIWARTRRHFFRPGSPGHARTCGLSAPGHAGGLHLRRQGPRCSVETRTLLRACLRLALSSSCWHFDSLVRRRCGCEFEVGVIQRYPSRTSASRWIDSSLAQPWPVGLVAEARPRHSTETSHAFSCRLCSRSGRHATWRIERLDRACSRGSSSSSPRSRPRSTSAASTSTASTRPTAARSPRVSAVARSRSDEADAEADGRTQTTRARPTSTADAASLAAELVSWAVGVAFGRFDVRLATGERELPPSPSPSIRCRSARRHAHRR